MVTRILKSAAHCATSLDYNETKREEGLAQVVDIHNLASDSTPTIYRTFRALENNSEISAKTQKFSFHMAINPGEEDTIEEEGVKLYAGMLMAELGYAAQPYVLYRHNDIEREHYHLVSCRIMDDGKAIKSSYEGAKVNSFNMRCAEWFGFSVGLSEREKKRRREKRRKTRPRRIRPGESDLLAKMRTNLDFALSWRYPSRNEFRTVLHRLGMDFSENRKGEMSFFIVDGKGAKASKAYNERTVIRFPVSDMLDHGIENDAEGVRSLDELRSQVKRCLALNGTYGEFCESMKAHGYVLALETQSGENTGSLNKAAVVAVIDTSGRRALDLMAEEGLRAMLLALPRSMAVDERNVVRPAKEKRRIQAAGTHQEIINHKIK